MKSAILALCLIACGASARQRTVSTIFTTVDSGCQGFSTYAHGHALEIIARASDGVAARASLEKWRTEETKVIGYCDGAYRAVAIAAQVDDDRSLASLAQAALILVDELKALKVIK